MRTLIRALLLSVVLTATALGPLASGVTAAFLPDASQAPGQWWGGGFVPGVAFGPDPTSPYSGSPGYPYYRYGAYYGSAYGLPYPVAPAFGGYTLVVPGYSGDLSAISSSGRCIYPGLVGVGGGYGSTWDPYGYGAFWPAC
jgi:hypothetical protein